MCKIRLLMLAVCVAIIIPGCSVESRPPEDYKKTQSIWQQTDYAGDICGYLPDNDADVKEIIQLIQKHADCVDNRSMNNLLIEDERKTYTRSFAERLEDNHYQEQVEKMYRNNNLSIASTAVFWCPSTISADRRFCTINIDSVFTFKEGTQSYLNSIGVDLDQNYLEHRIYYCEKEKGVWKIVNIEKSALSLP